MLLLLKYKRSIKSAKRLLLEFEVSSDSLLLPYLILFQHSFFHYIDQSIQSHCHNTEQNNRHEKPIHLKYLTGIDDQISKSAFGSEKFSDNDSHKTKSDIDFHIALYYGNGIVCSDQCSGKTSVEKVLNMIAGTEEGSTTFVSACLRFPCSVYISLIFYI